MKKHSWLNKGLLTLLLAPMLFLVPACTDLGEETFGIVTPDQFFQTDEEITAALAPIYAQLRATLWSYHNLSQVSADENIVPTRGSDWFDGGRWLAIDAQTWDPGLSDLNGAWIDAYTGVARANALLEQLEGQAGREALVAELKTLRAFYYYILLDLFGNVPIVGDDEFVVDPNSPPSNEPRVNLFNFLVSELTTARDALPSEGDVARGRATKGMANALLASLYLNAEVWTGTVSASGLQRGSAKWAEARDAANSVITSGDYSLATNWFDNFSPSNENSPEHIFVVQHLAADGLGLNFPMRALHYNQLTPSPWNGFSTIAEVYNAFDDADPRKQIFLIGQGINYQNGQNVNDRNGNPLIFTVDINNIQNATEGEGVRILKFAPDPNNVGGNGGNDYPYFRLAEMYLIRAEAKNELGDTAGAIADVNIVRARVGVAPLAGGLSQAQVREAIYNERLFELTYEARRRQDLIRAGRFTQAWSYKAAREPFRILFPIPQTQIDANPNLTQNAGY